MIVDLLWLTALLCWLLGLLILYRHGPKMWLIGVILAIVWLVWRFGASLPVISQEADRAELADHMTVAGKAYPHGARLDFLSMGYAGDCVLLDSRPTGGGRYWVMLECSK